MASLEVPLVSVVIPAYNAAATVEATIGSALGQSFPSIEVIVVDDGSTDTTAELVTRLARTDRRLRLVQSENKGVAHARNLGIEHSRGTFIAPLDADDLWQPTKLEKQVAAFQRDPELGFVYCFHDRINSSDEIVWRGHSHAVNGWAFLQHAVMNFVGNGSNFMVPRRIAMAAGGYSSALRKSAQRAAKFACCSFRSREISGLGAWQNTLSNTAFIQQHVFQLARNGLVGEHCAAFGFSGPSRGFALCL